MVLAAAIVGSGELIATTTLGAQVGYAALWIVLLSCAVKPVVQAEMGRYTIASGETGLEALEPRARPAARRELAALGLGADRAREPRPGGRHVRRRRRRS